MTNLEAALEAHRSCVALHGSAVRPPEQHLLRARANASPVKDFRQRHAGPLCRADGTQIPFLALDGRVELRAAVSGALEGDDPRLRRHVVKVSQAEAQRSFYEAANRKPEGGRIEVGDL